ncbi:hypothetical protein C8Q74DRAFT_1171621, partial [Fomes fomentarius]
LPPGPIPTPLLDDIFDLPRKEAWRTFSAWAKDYGDVLYVHLLGRSITILNSVEAINDLFESRFTIYSDRP